MISQANGAFNTLHACYSLRTMQTFPRRLAMVLHASGLSLRRAE